jgi:hypothetical protein
VKWKVVLSGLAIVGSLALSATMAQAGAGGSPTTLLGFFVCHDTGGGTPAGSFDLESPVLGPVDSEGSPLLQRIKLGKAALACAFARLFPAPTRQNPTPDPIEPGVASEMTCYPIVNPKPSSASLFDVFGEALVGDLVGVRVASTQVRYLCSPAGYFQHTE